MTTAVSFKDFETWLRHNALPLWSGPGLDKPGLGIWEALDHDGKPIANLHKRLRVQARQTYVFATIAQLGYRTGDMEHALHAFDFMTTHGFDADKGRFAAVLARDGAILDQTQDLYDLAFILLALAALSAAGRTSLVQQWLPLWESALASHTAERGWLETMDGRQPRRQNPHMHMFEAATSFFEVSGDRRFLDLAKECLLLFKDVFYNRDSGLLLEHFASDWSMLPDADHFVEPGHMMEWIYLISRFEQVTGEASGVDLRRLFDRARDVGLDSSGAFLVDQVHSTSGRSDGRMRLWPQTEYLKASIVLTAHGERLPPDATPSTLYGNLSGRYFSTPVKGGWYDQFDGSGALISTTMPASTFYHVLAAFLCMKEHD